MRYPGRALVADGQNAAPLPVVSGVWPSVPIPLRRHGRAHRPAGSELVDRARRRAFLDAAAAVVRVAHAAPTARRRPARSHGAGGLIPAVRPYAVTAATRPVGENR